jgi:hypothetical protein
VPDQRGVGELFGAANTRTGIEKGIFVGIIAKVAV